MFKHKKRESISEAILVLLKIMDLSPTKELSDKILAKIEKLVDEL